MTLITYYPHPCQQCGHITTGKSYCPACIRIICAPGRPAPRRDIFWTVHSHTAGANT